MRMSTSEWGCWLIMGNGGVRDSQGVGIDDNKNDGLWGLLLFLFPTSPSPSSLSPVSCSPKAGASVLTQTSYLMKSDNPS